LAEYVRYDVYIPVQYWVIKKDPVTRAVLERIPRTTDELLIDAFVAACVDEFGGATRFHPRPAPYPYKGLWRESSTSEFEVDRLTAVFVLVKSHDEERALPFFTDWKRRLERRTHQKIILVTHQIVHTIGDFF
jgi:hypothetical protein